MRSVPAEGGPPPRRAAPMVNWVLDALAAARASGTPWSWSATAPRPCATCCPPGVDGGRAGAAARHRRRGAGRASPALDRACDTVVVACGDTPLLPAGLVARMVQEHGRRAARRHHADRRASTTPGPTAAWCAAADGTVARVVEARDASARGAGDRRVQRRPLRLRPRRASTRRSPASATANAPGRAATSPTRSRRCSTGRVAAIVADDPEAAAGVNDRVELAACEAALQRRLREELMRGGVTMPDPRRSTSTPGVEVGADTVAVARDAPARRDPDRRGLHHRPRRGHDRQRRSATAAPSLSAHVIGAELADGAGVGPVRLPAARARGWSAARGRAPTSSSRTRRIGAGAAKVPHLSYVGDATVGEGTNIGAGNITANYDGFRKHRTHDRRAGQDRLGLRVRRPRHRRRRRDDRGGVHHHRRRPRRGRSASPGRASRSSRGSRRRRRPARPRAAAEAKEASADEHEHRPGRLEAPDGLRGAVEPGRSAGGSHSASASSWAPSRLKTFANGEIYVRFEESVRGADVFLVQSTSQAGERQPDGAVDHDQRGQAGLGAPHHGRHPLVRLLAPGQEVGPARADHGQADRRPAAGRRRATAC